MPQNFRKFFNQIYAGAEPSVQDLKYMKDILGIKLIVSLDQEAATKLAPFIKQLGIKHVIIPIEPSARIGDSIRFLRRYIVNILDNQQPAYIHCKYGKDRTGLALAMYRVLKHGWSCDNAIAEAKRYGYGTGISLQVQNLWYTLLCTLAQKGDIGNLFLPDIGTLHRNQFDGGNIPPAFFPMQSFAPYASTGEAVLDTPRQEQIEGDLPMVGQYNNVGPMRGWGPVENSGILQII